MNPEIFEFNECGNHQRIAKAKKVLAGQGCICIVLARTCLAIRLENTLSHESAIPRVSEQFATGKYPDFERLGKSDDFAQDEWVQTTRDHGDDSEPSLIDVAKFRDWATTSGTNLTPGIYPLLHSDEIAAEIVSAGCVTSAHMGQLSPFH